MICPECGETINIATERRLYGNSFCKSCEHSGTTSSFMPTQVSILEDKIQKLEVENAELREQGSTFNICMGNEKLEAENKRLKSINNYLKSFVEFCECKNPKGDCICI